MEQRWVESTKSGDGAMTDDKRAATNGGSVSWMRSTKPGDGATTDEKRAATDGRSVSWMKSTKSGDGATTDEKRAATNGGSGTEHNEKSNQLGASSNLSLTSRGPRSRRKKIVTDIPDVDKWMWRLLPRDQYNLEDFQTSYDNAKFYVIKSTSEDDIHKSIKYSVWSSTNHGNWKLNGAFQKTQDDTSETDTVCPIFLFFSVNWSGQFLGVAEMVGKVDFVKSLNFWQSEDWNGFFPVKWHIIKDIPSRNLSHIFIESIDRPVTRTRDTQEIGLQQGLEMLKIFKNYTAMTSMLDDFNFYEKREQSLRAKRDRHASYFNRENERAGERTIRRFTTKNFS